MPRITNPACRTWDFCIAGAGPCGLALAFELASLGEEVLLVEPGGSEPNAELADDSRAVIETPQTHSPMDIAVCRAMGGTSWFWGGRCVDYDEVDWIDRAFVPEAHWPIAQREVAPFYPRAAEYLLCGSDRFAIPLGRPLDAGITLDFVERWARESRIMLEHRDRLENTPGISIALHSPVVDLELASDGTRVESVTLGGSQGRQTIRARHFVLAMGGVETTRLLLHVQRRWPQLFGGQDGPLGRYYMGHISGKIADILFDRPQDADLLDFKLGQCGAYYRRRFMLTRATQLRHRVLNTAFWPDNPPFYDPSHLNGVLSAVFLALAFPATGRLLLPEAIRRAHTGPTPYRWGAHLKNAILGAPRGMAEIYEILRDRFIRKPRKPGFLVPNRAGRYALHYHAEQVPNALSRIQIAPETDRFGLSRARIDFRYCEQDVESVIDSHALLDDSLRKSGLGRLEYRYAPAVLSGQIWKQASDGVHQVGTTRMGTNARTSVVNPDLKVHGIDNLSVASSSVFPSSGQANSTFLAVAFSVRLAHHLSRLRAIEAEPIHCTPVACST